MKKETIGSRLIGIGFFIIIIGVVICDYRIWKFALTHSSMIGLGLVIVVHGIALVMIGQYIYNSK